MSNKSHSLGAIIVTTLSTLLVVVAASWVIFNRQYVLDQFNVWWYKPTADITLLSERSGMSDRGTFFLYASQPRLESAADFNKSCVRQEPNSAILGCYSAQRIYVYDVTNKDLDGVEEVTAAHETLHAIWERMSSDEKTKVGALLEAAYKTINDPKLNERMAYYNRTEPGERDNELHSILGTEYKNLGSDLEAHYANYFTDRAKVVDLHDAYQSKFDALKTKSDALASELAHLKTSIDTQSTQYNNEVAAINADAQKLKQSYDSVDRTNQNEIDAYNAQRQQLLDRIAALNVLKIKIINETNTYNQKVVEYNALVVSTNELNKSLDSTLSPTPSL